MARVKRGVQVRERHKKVLKQAKGHYGARSRCFRTAKQSVVKASQYAYRDRRVRKRDFRSLWIVRINAAVRAAGLTYSVFMCALKQMGVRLDRKILSGLAFESDPLFAELIERAKAHIQQKAA